MSEDFESESRSGSNSSGTNDESFDDWVEEPTPCRSLFEEVSLPSVQESIKYDREKHGFDLNAAIERLGLKQDFYGRTRFVNYIRKNNPSPVALSSLTGKEDFFKDDAYLHPVISDDPLLFVDDAGDWSDEDEPTAGTSNAALTSVVSTTTAKESIKQLQNQLNTATLRFNELQERMRSILQDTMTGEASPHESKPIPSSSNNVKTASVTPEVGSNTSVPPRDDDTHYFESYGYQEIHATMLRDSVRTMSYAKFILSNPQVFRGKVVMDVGCGTGILSMLAAKAGARQVFAVDASDVVHKARQNIKDNGFQDIITVIQGKVETITLPSGGSDSKIVDVIISEWMGYALLYESMLDSVLVARDRFLKPSGIMAPSQCRMMLSLAETTEVWKDKIGFWDDVYGFKMTSMAEEAFGDSLVEHLPPSAVVSNLVAIKDIPVQRITTRQLDFSQDFEFVVTSPADPTIHAFLLYFDTYFQPDGSDVPQDAEPELVEVEGNFVLGDMIQIGNGRSKSASVEAAQNKQSTPVSFSTGPKSLLTHWKQTVFLLRKPFKAIQGTKVTGKFFLKKSETNSRELDVEIHYSVSHTGLAPPGAGGTTVQMYKVR